MGALAARRCVEWLLGLYFVSHIPITLFLDMQAVLPPELYPQEVRLRGPHVAVLTSVGSVPDFGSSRLSQAVDHRFVLFRAELRVQPNGRAHA